MNKDKNKKAENKARRKQCFRKIGYSRKGASAARRRLEDRGETNLHIYLCPFCRKYHVGHKGK